MSAVQGWEYVQDDDWDCGHVSHSSGKRGKLWAAINGSLANRAGSKSRLYLKDGTFPGELPQGCSAYDQVPGWHLSPHSSSALLPVSSLCSPSGLSSHCLRLHMQTSVVTHPT